MKYMKYSSVIIISICALSFFYSCDKKLDIDPQQSMDAKIALSTPENIKATLVGAYVDARSRWTMGSQFIEYSELLASTGDLQHVGSNREPLEIINKTITVDNSYITSSWIDSYHLINTVNNVLGVLSVMNEQDRNKVQGEALFLRGWIYFELTRLWGLPYISGQENNQAGVPLMIKPTTQASEALLVARNSVAECYSQIIEDLTFAKNLLPENNGFWADTYAASSMLARVYLQQGKFSEAAAEANRVIESGKYQLMSTPKKSFNNPSSSTEDIFALQNNLTSNSIWLTERYASLNGMGRGDYQMGSSFFSIFESADLRGQIQLNTQPSFTWENIESMYYTGVGTIRNGGVNTAKYANYYAAIPMIRLAEIYLIRAEANFRLVASGGNITGPNTPLEDINLIRTRAQAPALASQLTLEQIMDERYRELCWEGHRLHDLKRWQMDIGTLSFNAGNLILPIPRQEMEINSLLEQNSFYQ
ncbi:MAG: RagB/SusD family nutrient uptake outer membrane protein [Bacteroidetes bacterium HGW-Bacteroidetes-1]|jgi:tetratricopeptide (TPR) repeat protein|nr:MAG: RagB/SusD family nutrient uptake outer membrane protein [Bacteroidetes bacterium HGW-Bacteroidetes-1]